MNSSSRTITVELAGSYSVLVENHLLSRIGVELRRRSRANRVGILSDNHVAPLHLQALQDSLRQADFDPIAVVLPAGEDHKTLTDLLPAFDALLEARMDRHTPIIGLGGGVITDMAGFLAATILRGVPLFQVPTSLLAMVDASVGGKTGVNHRVGKNLIGAFHQPSAVFIDPATLKSLPNRELVGGLAECIKHEIIRDADGFADLEKSIDRALAMDADYLCELIAHNVAIKARVVEADPFERGERAHLNFGHTFGHAIESVSHFEYSHGQSVALGMVAACRLAVALRLLDEASCQRIVRLIERAGLPVGGLRLDVEQVHRAMAFDKKVAGEKLRLVLPDRIGHVIIRDDVPDERVRQAIEQLR